MGIDRKSNFINKRSYHLFLEEEVSMSKKEFTKYLKDKSPESSGKPHSYIKAMEVIEKIFFTEALTNITDIWNFINEANIDSIYQIVIKNQKVKDGIFSNFKPVSYWKQGYCSAALNEYKNFLKKDLNKKNYSTLQFSSTSLPKPFLLLAGISGTGKTRFVKTQAKMENGWEVNNPKTPENYELVSVRPDWHEPSDLLGYVSRMVGEKFIPTGFTNFVLKAWYDIFQKEGDLHKIPEDTKTFWLCLDEMNLAPVEQYFADYLSVLETRCWKGNEYYCDVIIKDYLELIRKSTENSNDEILNKIARDDKYWENFIEGIPLPPNLIVAGTINMDETTHGLSRKVIDRALTLDFQEFFPNNFAEYFAPKVKPKLLKFSTISHIETETELNQVEADPKGIKSVEFLQRINEELKNTPFELAFRTLNELLVSLKYFNPKETSDLVAVWDDYLMQKVLPRIEGDADKLLYDGEEDSGLLHNLKELIQARFCEILGKEDLENSLRPDLLNQKIASEGVHYCSYKSIEKLEWMQKRLIKNQYTSFCA